MESYGKYSGRNEWNGIYYPVFVFLVSALARNAYEGSIKTLVSRQLNKKKQDSTIVINAINAINAV